MPDPATEKTPFLTTPRRLDARIKIVLLLAASFFTQYQPDWLLPAWLATLCVFFLHKEMRTLEARRMIRGGMVFSAFWLTAVSLYLLWQTAGDLSGTLRQTLPLTARILALAMTGTIFVRLTPPLESGTATAWFLRPLLGKQRAATAGLALALVAWFLPVALRLLADVNAGIKIRHAKIPAARKAVLLPGAALRLMEQKAHTLALGISSRMR